MANRIGGLTPLGKAVVVTLIVSVVSYVYYRNYGNPFAHSEKTETAALDEKAAFKDIQKTSAAPTDAPQAVTPATIGTGKLDRPLRVAINTWAGHAAGLVANGGLDTAPNSINAKLGLNVSYSIIEDPDQKIAALRSGNVDVVWDTVDSWAREAGALQANNFGARAFIQEDFSFGGDGMVATQEIRRVEDLKGKKVALVKYSPSHWLLLYTLGLSNLSKADIDQIEADLKVFSQTSDAAAAFKAGHVDAVVTWEPDLSGSVKARSGAHVLFDTKSASKVIGDVLVAREDVLNQYPQTFQAFTDGWFQGVEAAKAHPDNANIIVGKALNLPPADVGDMISGFTYSNFADNAWFFGLSLPKGQESHYENLFSKASALWRSRGAISSAARASDRAAPQFIAALAPKYQNQTITEAPQIAQAAAKVNTDTTGFLNKQITVNFETGSAVILEDSALTLDELAKTLTSFGNTVVKIEGHTDAQGSATVNKTLSEARAKAVRDYLVQHYSQNPERFKVFGFGPSRPLATNATPEGRARNRRTEVRLISNE